MRLHTTVIIMACLAGITNGSLAQETPTDGVAGSFQVRLRAVTVSPEADASITIGGTAVGGTTSVGRSVIPEADFSYFFTDNFAVELIAGVTRHTVTNTVTGRVASVSLLPPTLVAQYHFDPTGTVRPYVGAGINYTFFYNANSALPNISFSHNVGYALQAGVDVPLRDGYFLNFDVKKLFLNTGVTAAGGVVRANATLDPWLLGVGIGMRF